MFQNPQAPDGPAYTEAEYETETDDMTEEEAATEPAREPEPAEAAQEAGTAQKAETKPAAEPAHTAQTQQPAKAEPAVPAAQAETGTCKLKKLLVIIFGCITLTVLLGMDLRELSHTPAGLVVLYLIGDTASVGAMLFFHVLKKNTFPVILAAVNLLYVQILPVAIYGASLTRNTSEILPNLFLNMGLAVLLLLYTIMGKSKKDAILWFILYLAVFLLQQAIYPYSSPEYILSTFHTVVFFAIGYSPDKWYRKKQTA